MKLSRSRRDFGGDVGKSHPAPRVGVKNELLGSVAEQIDQSPKPALKWTTSVLTLLANSESCWSPHEVCQP